ncbi:SHQ1 protein-domain-containing protein [Hysterangium stoloniferum]|nr:SHQ1 protein-domain-containing protein [Hysterangium stoloniferum]
MLTPRFSCSQTEAAVVVSVYVPSVRASDVEIHVEGTLFSLHINPYFLRINFPKRVVEDEASSARYDPSSGYLTVALTKEVPGEQFEDLDLLSKLLAPRSDGDDGGAPVIEVIASNEEGGAVTEEDEIDHLVDGTAKLSLEREHQIFLQAAMNDWRLPQQVPDETPQLATSQQHTYGFLDMHSGYFRHAAHSENEANELGPDAETLGPDARRMRGEQRVQRKFGEDYYLADYVNDEEIQELIRWMHPFSSADGASLEFTEDERLAMLRLPRKEYLPTPSQTRTLYLTLVSLLFSVSYDTRTTLADPTSESAWTISALTPPFACLSPPISLMDALLSSYRRALAFPLYRSFALCERCRLDVSEILRGGRRTVVKALLGMKKILDRHDVYYVYSKIWGDDFCVWIQSQAVDDVLFTLADEVAKAVVEKKRFNWELDELELAATETMAREPDSDDEDDDELESMTPSTL